MIIEDEPMIRAFAVLTLINAGYDVFDAADGEEAAYLWSREEGVMDLLMVDTSVPGSTGEEVAESFRALNHDLPILFAGEYGERSAITHGEPDIGYIAKPYSVRTLLSAVAGLLALSGKTQRPLPTNRETPIEKSVPAR
jgi:DNA-binding response OmpR family regulator